MNTGRPLEAPPCSWTSYVLRRSGSPVHLPAPSRVAAVPHRDAVERVAGGGIDVAAAFVDDAGGGDAGHARRGELAVPHHRSDVLVVLARLAEAHAGPRLGHIEAVDDHVRQGRGGGGVAAVVARADGDGRAVRVAV